MNCSGGGRFAHRGPVSPASAGEEGEKAGSCV